MHAVLGIFLFLGGGLFCNSITDSVMDAVADSSVSPSVHDLHEEAQSDDGHPPLLCLRHHHGPQTQVPLDRERNE